MTDLFSDTTKFKKVTQDTTLTQLTTLQNYLRTIYNRDEIQVEYESMRPTSTKSARAHGLPKIHKTFDTLPPFRPIIDTTGTAYQPTAKFITQLLNPLTSNEFTIRDIALMQYMRLIIFLLTYLMTDTSLFLLT
jgi:hypothetical protein